MFVHPALSWRFNQMHEFCPHCGVRLEPEPGFYQGAMYVGYGFTVACIVIVGVILYYLLDNPSPWLSSGVVGAIMLVLVPWNYRYSRVVYLYLFGGIHFDPKFSSSSTASKR
jgi:hypothetical protein